MNDGDAVDPDVTPAYGIVSGTGPTGFVRSGAVWLVVVVGIVVGLIVLTLVISLT